MVGEVGTGHQGRLQGFEQLHSQQLSVNLEGRQNWHRHRKENRKEVCNVCKIYSI